MDHSPSPPAGPSHSYFPSSLQRSNSTVSANSTESTQTAQGVSLLKLDSSVEPSSTLELIERYSGLLSIFAFERAQELAEKQHGRKGVDPALTSITSVMIQLAGFEKQYMNLAFLIPKGFLRKDSNLKGIAEHIRVELRKLIDSTVGGFTNEFLVLVTTRLDLMEFYEKLCLLGTAKNVEVVDFISDFEVLYEKYTSHVAALGEDNVSGVILKSLDWEVEMLFNLLKSHSSTKCWDFFGALITIQEAHKRILEWGEHIQLNQLTKKSSFLKAGSSTSPGLYNWLLKFKAILVSKLSFYFYELLARHSNAVFDIRLISVKLQTDYVSRCSVFQKKSDALAICLVFDARDVEFNPIGYQHPTRSIEPLTGLDTFPAVLSIPAKPLSHWPNVVMLISGRLAELNADKFVGFFDAHVQTTYFIQRIEPRMFILAVYESRKPERDSYVLKFMSEIASELKCGKIFSTLKLSAK